MTQEEQAVLMIKGAITEMSGDDQARVKTVLARFDELKGEFGHCFIIAIALRGAEFSAEPLL